MNLKRLELTQLPTPLAHALQCLMEEDQAQPFRQVHRLIDTIEVFCKLYTVAGVSQLAELIVELGGEEDHRERLDTMKAMLSSGLRTPSLGVWWMFARESARAIEALGRAHVLPDGVTVLTGDKSKLRRSFDGYKNTKSWITFRNGYAHGATPKDEECKADLNRYGRVFYECVQQASELTGVELIVCDLTGQTHLARGLELSPLEEPLSLTAGRCYLRGSEGLLIDLHPMLCYREAQGDTPAGFYFYNDLRDKHASLLNYPEASHLRDKEVRASLLDRYPIDVWKKETKRVELNPFRERIEELIEVFKGRREELARFTQHLSEYSAGFFMIWGPPGVGKSALLARFAELLRWGGERREEAYPDVEWAQLEVKLVDYYLRRGSSDKVNEMFDSVNQRLEALYNLRLGLGGDAQSKQALFLQRLRLISERLEPHQRLILIFDGLDEAPDELIKLLPRSAPQQVPDKILVFYGARPQRELKYNFYDSLERERRAELSLGGLSVQDTRALLYEHVNKYELEASFVEAVAQESEGNPLYLKLLCQGLEQRIYKLNDASALPKEIGTLYENALVRMNQEHPQSGALLCALASAKDALSLELMRVLLDQAESQIEAGPLAAAYELLTPRTEQRVTSYQLFHESLREHLKKHFASEVQRYEEQLKAWCCDWLSEYGDPKHPVGHVRRYAMRFAIPHSLDLIKYHQAQKNQGRVRAEQEALIALVDDERWRRVSFEATGSGEAMRLGFTSAQGVLMERATGSAPLEDIMRYALWYHEEPRRFYEEQRATLSTAPERGREKEALEQVGRMANMGETPRLKLLLAFSAFWAPTARPLKSELPLELTELIDEWLEEARDPNLEDLWSLSHG